MSEPEQDIYGPQHDQDSPSFAWVEGYRAGKAEAVAAFAADIEGLREALRDMTGAYHLERRHAKSWDACQHPRCQNARLAIEGRGPFLLHTVASEPRPTVPTYCDIHQHYKWCGHNGGVMGATGYEAPLPSPKEAGSEP